MALRLVQVALWEVVIQVAVLQMGVALGIIPQYQFQILLLMVNFRLWNL